MYKTIGKVSQLDENNWLLINSKSVEIGAFTLQAGQTCQHIFFHQTGLLRSFYTKEGDERNVAFTQENSFLAALTSLRSGQPALLLHLSLSQIASFLGTRRKTLSRIRERN